jgi:hypothetical protein
VRQLVKGTQVGGAAAAQGLPEAVVVAPLWADQIIDGPADAEPVQLDAEEDYQVGRNELEVKGYKPQRDAAGVTAVVGHKGGLESRIPEKEGTQQTIIN